MQDEEFRPPPSLAGQALAHGRVLGRRAATVLVGRVAEERRARSDRQSWLVAVAVAALIGLTPLSTRIGADLLAHRATSQAAAVEARDAPRRAVAERRHAAESLVRDTLRRPGAAGLIERVARLLPDDARLAAASIDEQGSVRLRILAPDPDRVRAALRRDPLLGRLRDRDQQRRDAALLVTFEGPLA